MDPKHRSKTANALLMLILLIALPPASSHTQPVAKDTSVDSCNTSRVCERF